MREYDIRAVAVEERRAVVDTVRAALLSGAVNDDTFAQSQASWDDCDSLAAWDGDRCVGHVGAFRFDSTVPGGARVPTAGITRVGVLPTHTRRGVLTTLMVPFLADARRRGNVLATLHASETPIYRRFGFGIASEHASATITTSRVKPWRVAPAPGSFRLLRHDEVLDVVPRIYDAAARWRVGSISRPSWWWKRSYGEAAKPLDTPQGKGVFVVVHADRDGVDDGFALYEVSWADGFAQNPTGNGVVHDLWGADADVELALWRYLFDVDLITSWRAEPRPIDEPARRAMHDSRAYCAVGRFDDQWMRILDVGTALGARAYGPAAGAVTLTVDDPMFGDNCATWTIDASGARSSSAPADLTVDIATLSAAYLGAISWRDLATVTATPAVDDDVLDRLDTLFAVRPVPFCGSGY